MGEIVKKKTKKNETMTDINTKLPVLHEIETS